MVGDKRSMPRQDFGPAPKPTSMMGPYQIQVRPSCLLLSASYSEMAPVGSFGLASSPAGLRRATTPFYQP